MFDICDRCGKEIEYGEGEIVTCKYIRNCWEHDTKRYLCSKCYEKFRKYMEKHYENFFTYLKGNR